MQADHHESAALDLLAAPFWDAEEALLCAYAAVDQIRADAPYYGIDDFQTATVFDYLNAKNPDGYPCRLGSLTGTTNVAKGHASVNRKFCKRADCITCNPTWIKNALRRCFANWDGAPIYLREFASYEALRQKRQGQNLTRAYAKRYLRLVANHAGECQIYFPGSPGEGAPVLDPAHDLLDALLRMPAYANGKKRIHLPARVSHALSASRFEHDALPDEDRTVEVMLPKQLMLHEANRILPGHGLQPNGLNQVPGRAFATRLIESVIGREVQLTMPYRRGVDHYSWTVTGLTAGEVYAVRSAWQPLRDLYYEQRTTRRKARQAAAPTPAWW